MKGEGRSSDRYWRGVEASRLGVITDRECKGRGSEKQICNFDPRSIFLTMYILIATEATMETQNSLKEKKKKRERLMRTQKGFGRTKYKVSGKGRVTLTCWGPGKGTESAAPHILDANSCREAAYHLLTPPASNSLFPSFSLHKCGWQSQAWTGRVSQKAESFIWSLSGAGSMFIGKGNKEKRKVIFHKLHLK